MGAEFIGIKKKQTKARKSDFFPTPNSNTGIGIALYGVFFQAMQREHLAVPSGALREA